MKLKELLKLRWRFPKDSEIILDYENNRIEKFEIEPKYTSEGKWLLVIKPNSKLDLKK